MGIFDRVRAGQAVSPLAGSSGGGSGGTVTSVALSVPSFLSVSGSPITTTGTLAVSLATQTANRVFAGPATGGAVAPTFRSLVVADLSFAGSALGVATLDSGGKVPASQLPNSVMEFQGQWNATTNSPTLADGTGNAGDVYRVSVAGSQNLGSGSITFAVSDWVMYSGTVWQLAANSAIAAAGGSNQQIQFNTSGVLGGSANFTWDGTRVKAFATTTLGDFGKVQIGVTTAETDAVFLSTRLSNSGGSNFGYDFRHDGAVNGDFTIFVATTSAFGGDRFRIKRDTHDIQIKSQLTFNGSTSGFTALKAAAAAGSAVFTLPTTDGSSGQFLSTNGSGILSFASAGGAGFTTTVTAGGTLVLTSAANEIQEFTGSAAHTLQLPNATTLVAGRRFTIANRSTGSITVKLNDTTTTLVTVGANGQMDVFVSSIGTTNGTWNTTSFNQTNIGTLTFNNGGGANIQGGSSGRITLNGPTAVDIVGAGLTVGAIVGGTNMPITSNGELVLAPSGASVLRIQTGTGGIRFGTTSSAVNTWNIRPETNTSNTTGDALAITSGIGTVSSGALTIATGAQNSGAASTGALTIQSGNLTTTTTSTATGAVILRSGSSNWGATGAVTVQSGDFIASNTNHSSGAVVLRSGDLSEGSNASGTLTIRTGNNSQGGGSGAITVQTGTITGGTRGKIQLQDGTQGTVGHVWTSTDASGSGGWAAVPSGTTRAWKGTFTLDGSGTYYTSTSLTFADLTNVGSPVATQIFSKNLTVTQIASNGAGVTFTAPANGTVRVTFIMPVGNSTASNTNWVRIIETGSSTTLDENGNVFTAGGSSESVIPLEGFFDVTSGSTYSFKLQMKVTGNTGFIGGQSTGGNEAGGISVLLQYI